MLLLLHVAANVFMSGCENTSAFISVCTLRFLLTAMYLSVQAAFVRMCLYVIIAELMVCMLARMTWHRVISGKFHPCTLDADSLLSPETKMK